MGYKMRYLINAIKLIAKQPVDAYYMDELSSKPIKLHFEAASLHPDIVIHEMNSYFSDLNSERENRFQKKQTIDGIEVYEFKNKVGTKGALALTSDQSKAVKAFVELNLMEKSSITKEKREIKSPKEKPTELQIVVTEASKEQANRIRDNLELISQQAGMPLKVILKAKGAEWEYSFKGDVIKDKLTDFKEKVNDYLYDLNFEWVEEEVKAANVGDYTYEPTYL